MSALAATNAFYSLDGSSQSPPKPASPVTPTAQYTSPQLVTARSFINMNPEVRGQHAPFPITPATTSPNATLEPPPGMSFADYLKMWSDSQTVRWLAESKCTHHAETFRVNDIRGDILLELDQATLKEMGITSIGDRLRILNAVKNLRNRAANRSPSVSVLTRHHESDARGTSKVEPLPVPRPHTKRPAPLRLNGTHSQNDLPAIIREQPDSAKSNVTGIRPLPQPSLSQGNQLGPPLNPPNSAHPGTPNYPRSQPPFPPPRGQPPPPPGRSNFRPSQPNWASTPTQESSSYISGSLSLAPQQQPQLLAPSPSSSNWGGPHHSSTDSRPSNSGSKNPPRSNSPLSSRGQRVSTNNPGHGRNGSGSLTSPSTISSPLNKLPQRPSTTGTSGHPYANAQAPASSLSPPSGHSLHTLSPIDEQFNNMQHGTLTSISPSPISQHPVGHRPFYNNSGSSTQPQPTLDEIRRKLVKFVLPDEGQTYTIDVAACNDGTEVLVKVLKKFGKGSRAIDGGSSLEYALTPQGGLTVDGWGVYLDFGQQDGPGEGLIL